jgi:hypothetical protein
MNTKSIVSLLLSCVLLVGCKKAAPDESLAPGELAKWNDSNVDIISVGAYNYTDYDIYDVFLLPPDKSDLSFAASGHGARAIPRDEDRWALGGASGANLAWDYRWTTPRKFKVWWFRIVDKNAYSASGGNYDKYTMKETRPGAAWCEGEIDVARGPTKGMGSDLILHFYPDGRVEGDVEIVTGPVARVDIRKRDELPVLTDRPCLKEVPNPYFGKKKPIQMN